MVEEGAAVSRRLPLWIALGVVAALLLCAAPVAVGVAAIRGGLQGWPSPTAEAASPTAAPSPVAGDRSTVTEAWLKQQVGAALDRQGAALLRGDERAYLAEVDPAGTATAKRQYASLRALGVARWDATVSSGPEKQADGAWRVLVRLEHCFAEAECTPSPITYGSRWAERPGGLRQVAVEPSLSTRDGPRPWETDALVVSAGKRVVVATTPDHRRELPRVVAEAERAAATADRYAVGGAPPERYLVYYAGQEQWKRWYGGDRPGWTAGYAVPVGDRQLDVVINAAAPHRTQLDDLLRHEMTHAASMPGSGFPSAAWWLVEGVAEMAATGGAPTAGYEGLADVRRLVRDGWQGPLDQLRVEGDSDEDAAAAYGVGYLAVRHLADRFGEPDVLAFFSAVVHRRRTFDDASREVFGEPWSTLHGQCVAAVRAAAG